MVTPAADDCTINEADQSQMTLVSPPRPTNDDLEDLLLSCRYGDIDDVKSFVTEFGTEPIVSVRDESGNTVLHMTCGNGHLGEDGSGRKAF